MPIGIRRIIALGAATTVLAGCTSASEGGSRTPPPLPAATTGGGSPATTRVAAPGEPRDLVTGLSVPWAIAFLPGGDALVTERDSARLLRVTPRGSVTEVGKVPGVVPGGEGGLMGVAVSPSYDRDRFVYLYFTAADDNRVVRFRYDGRLAAPRPIVTGIPKGANHNGGRIAFGPDKMLYIGTGEIYQRELAQDRGSLGGKILRVTPDGGPAPGNPFSSRVWTYGHRNVQGLAWDDKGRMYATEFGQDRFDEINLIERGHNYGWPDVEGVQQGRRNTRYTDPLLTWSTGEASPSGLAYASGSLWAAGLRGRRLWQVPVDADGRVGRPIAHYEGRYGRLRAVVRAPDGSLWVTTSNKDGRGDPARGDDRILVIPLR
ncbi:Glucose/arabinose dehydrogenase, beta-propeller fold [Thermomonospora echinospora]|uniref:Glucose/arabinose dehydrogenase, beta-propeller fold n=1 Tax=Thermomonospora echinospora TaxID=1992 RepID=A0A1H5UX27_9ACTN|nr:PQQ-dependent sugar dehydrogenase [Thermomonospora echinospora]SEF79001.1 Glucose/arabinose dehydrogenase, beta-propeller fold [Thermomonospora echinospora]